MIQLTIIRIEGYGPWTLTLGSDREAELQKLQAKIYYDVQRLFSDRNCLVFFNRFDEYFAITNGLSIAGHREVLNELSHLHQNLKMSMAIGTGTTALEANTKAYQARKEDRLSDGDTKIFGASGLADFAQIMHVDIDSSTRVGDRMSPYEITVLVTLLYGRLADEFLKLNALTFFLGGDNFMILSNGVSKDQADSILKSVTEKTGIKLNCGIGIGNTGRKAAEAATKALDTIRKLRDEGTIQTILEMRCP